MLLHSVIVFLRRYYSCYDNDCVVVRNGNPGEAGCNALKMAKSYRENFHFPYENVAIFAISYYKFSDLLGQS